MRLIILSILSCISFYTAALESIVAVVNNDVITRYELRERLELIIAELKKQNSQEPLPANAEQQLLEQMIRENIQVQMAERMGMRVDDQLLYQTLQQLAAQQKQTVPQFKEQLIKKGLPFPAFQKQIQRELMIQQVQQQLVLRKINVTEQEINNYLTSNPSLLEKSEYQIVYLTVSTEQEAEEIKNGSKQANWQALEPKRPSELPILFAKKVLEMQVNDISEPIKSGDEWHLIQLKSVKMPTPHVVWLVEVRHVLIKPNLIRAESEVKQQLQHIRERVLAGEHFSDLAKLYSEDILTARQGGNLKWVEPHLLGTHFSEAIKHLKLNEISLPFVSEQGWHIAQLTGQKSQDMSIEFQRQQVSDAIRRKKFHEALENWLIEIRDQAFVDIRL